MASSSLATPAPLRFWCSCVAVLFALSSLDASAQVNRCVDKNGKVTYQQRRCDNEPLPPTVMPPLELPPDVPVVAPAKAAPSSAQQVPGRSVAAAPKPAASIPAADDAQMRDVAYQIGLREWCDVNVPGFREQYGIPYQQWRARNAGMVQRIEMGTAYSRSRLEGREYMAAKFTSRQPEARSFCAGLSSVLLAR
jgi:hypothetical protein